MTDPKLCRDSFCGVRGPHLWHGNSGDFAAAVRESKAGRSQALADGGMPATNASDDDGEARYEQQARDGLPPERCPDCECCDKFDCWASRCAGGSCPCTEF